ncbi:MAG TPA: sodium/proton-translocating pyrophosphatase [Fimbriimonadaceae bacterium]|nr:sodium/proton-translocating pyrophosphatase [Fimbriimonadaceae bacterium]
MLLPSAASAGEANVQLNFANSQIYLTISLVFGVMAIFFAVGLSRSVLSRSPGSERMQEVGRAIKEGALAYLKRQFSTMIWFVVAIAIGLYFLYDHNFWVSVSFFGGVLASYTAGYFGMVMAVNGNMRTANAALTSYKKTLETAFQSGAVAGMLTVGMGLIGATVILWAGGSGAMTLLIGFGFGGSLAALFMRVGGGIFTKAADVGADLVGKVEAGIPEDDPRNPATIADNVGDNVGDCAGMAADVFESYEVTLVAAIVLGAATATMFDSQTWMKLILFALMARGIGILASMVGILMVRGTDDVDADPLMRIRKGFYASAVIAIIVTGGLAWFMMGPSNPINTSRLISKDEYSERQIDRVLAARDDLAKAQKLPPAMAWQVAPKDIANRPELKDIVAEAPDQAPPNASPDAIRSQVITGLLQKRDQWDYKEVLPPPVILSGYSPLELNSDNPALDYSIPKLPSSQTEEKAQTQAKFITLRDAMKQGMLDLVFVQLKREMPSAPGQPPQKAMTLYVGPLNRKYADEWKTTPPQQGITLVKTYDATVYATPDGEVAVGSSELQSSEIAKLTPYQFTRIYQASPKYIEDLIKTSQDQTKMGSAGFPSSTEVKMAAIEHSNVPWWTFFVAVVFGIGMAFAIELLTDYYVSTHKRPTQEVAGVSSAGPAPMIIQGFAYAAESSVFMVLSIVVALLVPLYLFNPATYGSPILSFYGIALVGLGLLTTTGFVLAMDTFGPISDNAQGVYEMSGDGHDNEYGQKSVQRLDAAGNTTKALTKGFAIATAVVAAVALFHSYLEDAHLGAVGLRLDVPEIFLGLLIGGAAPYLFAAFSINAVGRASFQLINEVRRQFKADSGIMAGTSKPDYGACVSIVTAAAQKELLGPGILAIFLPIAVAFGFSIGKAPTVIHNQAYNLTGAQALGGFLAGAILSGQLMAVLLANSGGMWDNAKKIIEDGLYGGKGTEAHKAGVVVDTVGDPFKDTAGPAMNPLIKVMNLIALLLAPVIIRPFDNTTLGIITGVAILLLIISIYFSKRGSLSTEMMKATEMANQQAEVHVDPTHGHPPTLGEPEDGDLPKKKRITVEEENPPPTE